MRKPPRFGPRSRSFFQIPDQYKFLASSAIAHVRYFILFENPMLNPHELEQLLSKSCVSAQQHMQQNLDRLKVVDAHVRQDSHILYWMLVLTSVSYVVFIHGHGLTLYMNVSIALLRYTTSIIWRKMR